MQKELYKKVLVNDFDTVRAVCGVDRRSWGPSTSARRS